MAVTATVIATQNLANGLKQVRASLLLDNAYPVAGYTITPAMFGLTRFAADDTLTALLDPIVDEVKGGELLAHIRTQKLLLSYPTGGATAAPGTPADPVAAAPGIGTFTVTTTPDAGATPLTGSAAKPALVGVITGALTPGAFTPGNGKLLPNAADASAITVVATARGYV